MEGKARDIWPELVPAEQLVFLNDLIERVSLRLPGINLVDRIEVTFGNPDFIDGLSAIWREIRDISSSM